MKQLRPVIIWVFGDVPHVQPKTNLTGLLVTICFVACIAMVIGEWFGVSGPPLLRSYFRFAVHGIFPFAAMVVWQSRLHSRALFLSSLGFLLVGATTFWQFFSPLQSRCFRDDALLLVLPSMAGLGLALWASQIAKENLAHWGLGLGDWRWWLPRTIIGCACLLIFGTIFVLAFDSLAQFYPAGSYAKKGWEQFAIRHLGIAIDFIGWEFLFRGLLLFGLYRKGNPWLACWGQAIPFFILHYERPPVELVLSLFGGVVSGWFILRARSFYPLVILHWVQITTVGVVAQLLRTL